MQSILNYLNSLYAEFVGLLFRLFGNEPEPEPVEPEPVEPEPEPIEPEPEPIELEPIDLPEIGIFGLRLTDGWD